MNKIAAIILTLLLQAADPCFASGTDPFKLELDDIYNSYLSLAKKPEDAESFYRLNKKAASTVAKIVKSTPPGISRKYWEPKYREIGIEIGHYSDDLEYTGKLLLDIHKIAPYSRYREHTLWASIWGEYYSGSYENSPPDISLLYGFIKEFPSSLYVAPAYESIASYYHGYYRYLRYNKVSDLRKRECYDSNPLNQANKATLSEIQKKGIKAYDLAIKHSKFADRRKSYRHERTELISGSDSEYDSWCDIMD